MGPRRRTLTFGDDGAAGAGIAVYAVVSVTGIWEPLASAVPILASALLSLVLVFQRTRVPPPGALTAPNLRHGFWGPSSLSATAVHEHSGCRSTSKSRALRSNRCVSGRCIVRIRRGLVSTFAALGLLSTLVVAPSAAWSVASDALAAGPAVVAAEQSYWWEWSDGSTARRRTFTQARYGVQTNLPHLVTHAEPAYPRRYVVLQYWQDGRWHFENSVKTNSRGIATIDINPYCSNDTWCDGTWKYRMKIGGQTARVTITFAER